MLAIEFRGGEYRPKMTRIVFHRCPQVKGGLVIQTGIASLEVIFDDDRKEERTDDLEGKGLVVQFLDMPFGLTVCLVPNDSIKNDYA